MEHRQPENLSGPGWHSRYSLGGCGILVCLLQRNGQSASDTLNSSGVSRDILQQQNLCKKQRIELLPLRRACSICITPYQSVLVSPLNSLMTSFVPVLSLQQLTPPFPHSLLHFFFYILLHDH